jgi:S1-C subfamily serine protease
MDLAAKFIKQGREQTGVEMALAWAIRSEDGQAIERNQDVAEMRDLKRQFDKVCFGEDGASFEVLRTNIIKCVMAQLGGIISQQNQRVGEAVSKADPMSLLRSQTVLARPTKDLSASLLSEDGSSSTAKMHTTPSIAAAARATVTVFTDQGSGSGFVISTNGFIITNHHVIDGAKRVLIASSDGKKAPAEVVDFNTSRDLAILKVTEGSWSPVQLGDVDSIAIGEPVYAIGSPADVPEGTLLDQTVTRGVVSGIREFPSDSNPNIKVEYIQTDAAINAGNSGGPLINEAGKVIGVNNQKIVGRGVEGLNFSISINEVKKLYFRYLND